jgi:two-component system LytT family sensor kinase
LPSEQQLSRLRITLVVCAAWILIAVVAGVQASLGSTLMGMGARPIPLATAMRTAMIQWLPWIPVTLAAMALTVRFPLSRESWRRYVGLHLAAALVLAFVANVLVVSGFWAAMGNFQGVAALAREGARWAAIRLHIGLLIYASVLAITQAVQYQRRAREKALHLARVEGQLARAHVQALNAQIRPHFLFNTLHTIGHLWRSGRSEDADAVLDHLGALFHKVQASTSRVAVPLSEELEMVREYLAIEQTRFRDRLRTSVTARDEVLDFPVPPLILQPIVENAVRHGISAVSSAGLVEVSAERTNGKLRLTVRDDGPGPYAKVANPGSGTGIRNTRERLQQMYGGAATFSLEAGANGGAVVVIDIPDTPLDAERR